MRLCLDGPERSTGKRERGVSCSGSNDVRYATMWKRRGRGRENVARREKGRGEPNAGSEVAVEEDRPACALSSREDKPGHCAKSADAQDVRGDAGFVAWQSAVPRALLFLRQRIAHDAHIPGTRRPKVLQRTFRFFLLVVLAGSISFGEQVVERDARRAPNANKP